MIPNPPAPVPLARLRRSATITIPRSTFFAALLPIAFGLGLACGYIFWGQPGTPLTLAGGYPK